MLTYLTKDITTVDRGIIAHGCNAQGVMGSGVARFLRDKYPQIFPRYHALCESAKANEDSILGNVDYVTIKDDLIVANCITQHLYGYDKGKYARPEAIEASLRLVYGTAQNLDLPGPRLPIYLPKIGAGRGGLSWERDVEPIIVKLVTDNPNINTYVCSWAE